MTPSRQLQLSSLPFPLAGEGPSSPAPPVVEARGFTLTAAAGSDLFLDPAGSTRLPDAERFVAPVSGDFRLSALVSPVFVSDFDSGVLIGFIDSSNWFKLCAELDPSGTTRVVSVVTRDGVSDDCDSWPIDAAGTYLRISRLGDAFAMHASPDARHWNMVRYFSMGTAPGAVRIGFLTQSPSGGGTTAAFTDVSFDRVKLTGVRDGS